MTFVLILHFDWLQGPHIGQNFEKRSKIFFSETVKGMKPILSIQFKFNSLFQCHISNTNNIYERQVSCRLSVDG